MDNVGITFQTSPNTLNLRFYKSPKVALFGQIVVFQTDCNKIEL